MRFSSKLFRDLSVYLDHYSSFNPSSLSIKQFLEFGRKPCERTSFIFLRKELPTRLANIMKELQLLPENLLRMPSVDLVHSWYERSFNEILNFEKEDPNKQKKLDDFCETLVKIRNRHSNVVQTMAQGVLELRETHQLDHQAETAVQYFLDRFYMNRISIRMLINQHAALFGADLAANNPRHVGCIDPNCNIASVITDAYENAKFLCDQYYLVSPDLIIDRYNISHQSLSQDSTQTEISLVYVPSHLYHILFEVFKNSMRAVVEHYGTEEKLPPLRVLLVRGNEDLTIKISDKGGGFPRSTADMLFNYMYSTAPQPSVMSNSAPLAGYGYGLPLSRLYARYFNGDLLISSLEGFGTDATIYLKVLMEDANELLPVFNKTSSKHYRSSLGRHDWSSGGMHHIIHNDDNNNFGPTVQPVGMRHMSTFKNTKNIP